MSENKEKNKNIEVITGDPKRAIRKLSVPMMVSMLLIMMYNLADSIWVAGLGADALAAIGFITPLFMVLVYHSTLHGSCRTWKRYRFWCKLTYCKVHWCRQPFSGKQCRNACCLTVSRGIPHIYNNNACSNGSNS